MLPCFGAALHPSSWKRARTFDPRTAVATAGPLKVALICALLSLLGGVVCHGLLKRAARQHMPLINRCRSTIIGVCVLIAGASVLGPAAERRPRR